MSDTALATVTPYPGLRPYEKHEQANFFGRDAERDILIDKLLANRLTLLFAASGVGKSSLLNAAVIPRLEDPLGEHLSVVCHSDWVLQPLTGLLDALKDALPHAPDDATTLPDLLGVASLFVRQPLVVILDQFEEFFRYQRGTDEYHALIEQLTEVIIDPQLPVNVVISMREDFALELNAFKPKLPTLLFENYYRLEKTNTQQAIEIITQPIKKLGFSYEPILIKYLIQDLPEEDINDNFQEFHQEKEKSVSLPNLQIVCQFLWEISKDNKHKTITYESYRMSGEAEDIILTHLDRVIATLQKEAKDIAIQLLERLAPYHHGVKVSYTSLSMSESLEIPDKEIIPVLDFLARQRILDSKKYKEEVWYSLSHDAYIKIIYDWYKSKLSTYTDIINSNTYSIQITPPNIKQSAKQLKEILLETRKSYDLAEQHLITSKESSKTEIINKLFTYHIKTNLVKPLLTLKGYSFHRNIEEELTIQERVSLAEQRRATRIKNDFRLRIMRKIRLIIGKIQQTFDQARLKAELVIQKTLQTLKRHKKNIENLIQKAGSYINANNIVYFLHFIALTLFIIDTLIIFSRLSN